LASIKQLDLIIMDGYAKSTAGLKFLNLVIVYLEEGGMDVGHPLCPFDFQKCIFSCNLIGCQTSYYVEFEVLHKI
jgi:hypothetical protein